MALVIADAEALLDEVLQIDAPPPNDAVGGRIGARFHDGGQLRLLIRRQPRRRSAIPGILQPVRPDGIEAMHPVPERLTVHAAHPCRLLAAHPVQHRSQRQKSPALVHVLRLPRKPPKLDRRIVRPQLHRCGHGAYLLSRHRITDRHDPKSSTSQPSRPLV